MPTATVIDIDAREDHPSIIFFTDRATGYTVAAEKETGKVIGAYGFKLWPASQSDTLWQAVLRYQRAMMDGKTCAEYYKRG